MTLKEYLEDYASPETKKLGDQLIKKELDVITNPKVREKCEDYLNNIHEGKRDFRF
jgi:2-iminoacetate synthase